MTGMRRTLKWYFPRCRIQCGEVSDRPVWLISSIINFFSLFPPLFSFRIDVGSCWRPRLDTYTPLTPFPPILIWFFIFSLSATLYTMNSRHSFSMLFCTDLSNMHFSSFSFFLWLQGGHRVYSYYSFFFLFLSFSLIFVRTTLFFSFSSVMQSNGFSFSSSYNFFFYLFLFFHIMHSVETTACIHMLL